MSVILNFLSLTEDERAAFSAAAPSYEQHFFDDQARPDPALLAQCEVAFGCPRRSQLAKMSALRWLQTASAGVDAYLVPGLLPADAMVTSAVGAYGQTVSEHLFAMLLALQKRLPAYRDQQRQAVWADCGAVKSLAGARVLIAGTGDIGSAFARLAKGMGAYTVGLRRDPSKPADGVDEMHPLADLDALLPTADVVALLLPQTTETDGLMTEARLRAMKPGAILLNGGRGPAVDCAALARVLADGHLWGAGLDVTAPEPLPTDHPLWRADRALITPHVAGGYHLEATCRRIAAIALDNLQRYQAGETLKNRMR